MWIPEFCWMDDKVARNVLKQYSINVMLFIGTMHTLDLNHPLRYHANKTIWIKIAFAQPQTCPANPENVVQQWNHTITWLPNTSNAFKALLNCNIMLSDCFVLVGGSWKA